MHKFVVALLSLVVVNQTLLGQDQHTIPTPQWLREYKFEPADFTFVRIKYDSAAEARRLAWATDYPDADIALSKHLAQATSLRIEPNGKVIRLTDENLSDYPFIYLAEAGQLLLSEGELGALRR